MATNKLDDFETPASEVDKYPVSRESKERKRTTPPAKLKVRKGSPANRLAREKKYEQGLKKASESNAAYWKKYGDEGNFKTKTIRGVTGTEFVYPPGYNYSDETISGQESRIKKARNLRNKRMKTENKKEGLIPTALLPIGESIDKLNVGGLNIRKVLKKGTTLTQEQVASLTDKERAKYIAMWEKRKRTAQKDQRESLAGDIPSVRGQTVLVARGGLMKNVHTDFRTGGLFRKQGK